MEDLQKEFVPYELALRMKQLGFDEPCVAYWFNNVGIGIELRLEPLNKAVAKTNISVYYELAPTFSQAFRWFREKYFYISYVCAPYENYHEFYFRIRHIGDVINEGQLESCESQVYKTYEEAELACLEKLLEIVEEKQK
jgi:hypothetical protein